MDWLEEVNNLEDRIEDIVSVDEYFPGKLSKRTTYDGHVF